MRGNVIEIPESYLDQHPGGAGVLMELAGKDGTLMFDINNHSDSAVSTMKEFVVGKVCVVNIIPQTP